MKAVMLVLTAAVIALSCGKGDCKKEYSEALSAYSEKNYLKTAELAQKALEARRSHGGAALLLARAHMLCGNDREFIRASDRALEISRVRQEAVRLRARWLLGKNKTAEAAAFLEKGISSFASDPAAAYLMAMIKHRDRDFDAALKYLQAPCENHVFLREIHSLMSDIYSTAGMKEKSRTEKKLSKALAEWMGGAEE